MNSANDSLNLSGTVCICKYDANMNKVEELNIKNLVVTAGKSLIAQLITGNSSSSITHMAIGSGSTAAAAADTALVTELTRVILSAKNASSNVMSFVSIYNPGTGTGTIQEAGLFNAASAGTMLCRTTFSAITKAATDTVSITWTVTIN